MKQRELLIAGCALLLAGALSAQNRSVAFDPVSGTWNGGSIVDFAGALANGTAGGRLSGDIGDGTFKITKGAGSATSAATQASVALPPTDDAATAAARRGFTEVNGWLSRAADLIPADEYAYKPTPAVRTVGQMIGHAIDGYQFYCNRAAGREVQWTSAAEKGPADKATIVQKLKAATAMCNSAYAGKAEIAPLIENIGHTSLHYGNIVTYMRMMGLVPPSS